MCVHIYTFCCLYGKPFIFEFVLPSVLLLQNGLGWIQNMHAVQTPSVPGRATAMQFGFISGLRTANALAWFKKHFL